MKKTTLTRPTVLDLFAGCGGMSLGLEAAGFDIACSVEFDPVHSLVHHVNFPYGSAICSDVSKVTGKDVLKSIKPYGYDAIDVIVGGPPCQGFSHIGKRQLDDSRNKLVFEYLRLVEELKPKYFIFENVPGIGSGTNKVFLDELVEAFQNAGYNIELPIKILDASHYGVAQKRRRLILLGSRNDLALAQYPTPKNALNNDNSPTFFGDREPILGAADVIENIANIDVFKGKDEGIDASKIKYNNLNKSLSLEPVGWYSMCHRRNHDGKIYGHVGSNHSEKSIQRFRNTEPGKTEKISRFFKLHPELPCNTIRAGTSSDHGAHTAPRPIHYTMPRCITIREAARLHSFPDWFQFHRTIWHGFREVGNAVAPLLAKCLGESLIKAMNIDSSRLSTMDCSTVEINHLTYSMTQASDYWGVDRNIIPVRKRLVDE
jgi:DNA (cytosine-5)-methyltransferase 1